MEFHERLKALRIQHSMTQKQLGEILGVSVMTIRNWESGTKTPSMAAIISLSKTLNTPSDYILGIAKDDKISIMPTSKSEAKLLSDFRMLDSYGRHAVEAVCAAEKLRVEETLDGERVAIRYIPKYTTPSAAGYSAPIDEDEYKMIPVDGSVPRDADFATIAHGDSMAPYIHDGDTVFVKKDCELDVGDIGIFVVNGARYCKQYYMDADRNLTLVSANPDLKNSNVYISADSNATVKCCGKVLLGYNIPLPDYFLEEL